MVWKATAPDPQFVISSPLRSRSIFYFSMDAGEDHLEPEFFFDWGDGFVEHDKVTISSTTHALVRVKLDDVRGLRRIRIDPMRDLGTTRFRYRVQPRNGPPPAWFAEALASRKPSGSAMAAVDVDAQDLSPPRKGRLIGMKRRARDEHEHFLQTVELARAECGSTRSHPDGPTTPLVSLVVPVYDTAPRYLDDLLRSFLMQPPGMAELILSDDGSSSGKTKAWLDANKGQPGVVVAFGPTNRGIAATSNAGLALASGKWVGLVDHDDALAPFALDMVAKALSRFPDLQFLYTDEAIVDDGMRVVGYFHKPAYDPVLLSGLNYVNHLSLYLRDKLIRLGGFRMGFDGSQDYDLLLRYLKDVPGDDVRHLPYPAYMWRRNGRSYSVKHLDKAVDSARRSLSERYAMPADDAGVSDAISTGLHRVRFDHLNDDRPHVSIIVPNRDSPDLMRTLLTGLYERTTYPSFDVTVVDNGSTDGEVLALYGRMEGRDDFALVTSPGAFNFSRQVNLGLRRASGPLFLLINNDIEIETDGWLSEMVGCLRYEGVGIVGARLLYPNRTLQHAGVIVGLGGLAGHWFVNRPKDHEGPMARLHVRNSVGAVTGACMLVSKACLDAVGPFDETAFPVAYNDVDFCLRAAQAGFRTVYTPFATLIHHESVSRGSDEVDQNRPRFLRDQAALMERHGTMSFLDRAYSPWYDRGHSEPSTVMLRNVPEAR